MILVCDLGTTNLKLALVDDTFDVVASERYQVAPENAVRQDTTAWRSHLEAGLAALTDEVPAVEIELMSVTSTSGTVIPVDADGDAITSAVMYNMVPSTYDSFVRFDTASFFRPTFTLPKIHWFKCERNEVYQAAEKFLNPTDYLIGYLTDEYNRTDPTNAYKMGYHPTSGWMTELLDRAGIDREKLPTEIVDEQPIGSVRSEIADQWGIPEVPVYNGAVDSVANFISATAGTSGSWSSSLGSSLSIKGWVDTFTATDRFYSYPHPEEGFILGGHSNLGTRWMIEEYSPAVVDEYLRRLQSIKTDIIAYPRTGAEVMPITRAHIPKFISRTPPNRFERFRAQVKALLYFEKWAFEFIERSGFHISSVSSTGYLSSFENINKLRASVLKRDVQWLDDSYMSTVIGAAAVAKYRAGDLGTLTGFIDPGNYQTASPDDDADSDRQYQAFKRYFTEDAWRAQQ